MPGRKARKWKTTERTDQSTKAQKYADGFFTMINLATTEVHMGIHESDWEYCLYSVHGQQVLQRRREKDNKKV